MSESEGDCAHYCQDAGGPYNAFLNAVASLVLLDESQSLIIITFQMQTQKVCLSVCWSHKGMKDISLVS